MINVPAIELLDEALARLRAKRRTPSATYRLQLNRFFTFKDARAITDYLHALGVSDCYASPYFKASPDSLHGYDISDHNQLNPSIGTEKDYDAWIAEIHANGMGQVLDTVPNHMGIGQAKNDWWRDVLENGPSSVYASYFDIDWTPVKNQLENQVLLPILGDQYGRVLENQEFKLTYNEGTFSINYWETHLPVAPRSYMLILRTLLETLQVSLAESDENLAELQSIIRSLEYLPSRTESDPQRLEERRREWEIVKRRLGTLVEQSAEVRAALDQVIETYNGVAGAPHSFDKLDELIQAQSYRLAYWRVAAEEINYRRFFDVNELAAIRMERPEVFETTHKLIRRLLAEGAVNGLRIDHPDGLFTPTGYFCELQKAYIVDECRRSYFENKSATEEEWAALETELRQRYDDMWEENPTAPELRALPIYVEKILARGEELPSEWTVDGTSGYEYLNLVNGVFVDGANEKAFTDLYATFIRDKVNFADLVYSRKKLVMQVSLASEINVLAHRLDAISERSRYYRDFTLNSLTDAIVEVIACFPVYRTYITHCDQDLTRHDAAAIETAIKRAKQRNPATDPSIFDFIGSSLKLEFPPSFDDEAREAQCAWVMKFQQNTGPVMAKGLEDTSFYIYNRLTSLNEVGGEPQHFGVNVATFHRQNQERLRLWPRTMLATSTHDTKRSEDVRARINVLSEIPSDWRKALTRWSRLNSRHKVKVEGQSVPDRNDEYLLYQTLLGSWPLESMSADERATYIDRIVAYMIKALREAKVNTSWLNPNVAYDEGVEQFVRAILDPTKSEAFLADIEPWAQRIIEGGMLNSLAQTLLKLTSPGIPDIYQGNEMWDFSLVDPDNRRPVDYDLRRKQLSMLHRKRKDGDNTALMRSLIDSRRDGTIKLYLTERILQYRREHLELFIDGTYTGLDAVGARQDQVCAYMRSLDDTSIIVAVPRLLNRQHRDGAWALLEENEGFWGTTALMLPGVEEGTRLRNLLTGEIVETTGKSDQTSVLLADMFATAPFALLAVEGSASTDEG